MVAEPSEKRDSGPEVPTKKRPRKRWFRLAAIVLSLLPLIGLELGLRAFGIGKPTGYEDPFVGFSKVHPLFELNEEGDKYNTVLSKKRFFGGQEFSAKKPEDAFRAFCLGGSTVRGRPYETPSAFAKWLELELDGREPDRFHEVINCGGLSYASYRLLPILEEVLNYEPDAIIVATGHNEFLEDRTYKDVKNRSGITAWVQDRALSLRTVTVARKLLGKDSKPKRAGEQSDGKTVLADDVDARLDQASGYASYHFDEAWKEQVNEHFGTSLRAMVRICKAANVPLIFVHLGSNLRDCPPFKSEHPTSLSAEDEAAWQDEFEAASRAEFKDPEATLEHLRAAEAISEQHPLMAFRIARCLDRMGRVKEADNYYHLARDWDICPLRITTSLSQTLVEVIEETKTPMVEEAGEIDAMAMDHLPGNDWYMDHVHPSILAHQLIGQRLAEKVVELKLVKDSDSWDNVARRKLYQHHFEKIGGERFLADGGRRVQWLENWARRNALFDETLPDTPRAFLHKGFREFEFALNDDAYNSMKTALDQNPELGHHVLDFTFQLFEGGRASDGRALLKLFNDGEFSDEILATARVAAVVLAEEVGDQQSLQIARENLADSAEKVPPTSLWHQQRQQRVGSGLP